jgi:hypothetical protein
MRVAVIILLLLLLPSVYAVDFTWGCCLPQGGDCVAGDKAVYATQAAFNTVCGDMQPGLSPVRNGCVSACITGCCCASNNVPSYSTINKNEDLLAMTQWQCTGKSTASLTYNFMSNAGSCVETCGGTAPPTGSLTLQGTVKKIGGSAMTNEPVILMQGTTRLDARTDATGKYVFADLQPKLYTLIVAPTSCKSQTYDVRMDASKTKNFDIDCSAVTAGCSNLKPVITNLAWVKGTDKATFDITYDDKCTNFQQFEPLRCQGTSCTAIGITTTKQVTDSGLQPKIAYCYKVQARTTSGVVTSDPVCLTAADAQCMTPTERFCGDNTILSCTDKNALVTTSCGNLACTMTANGPVCAETPACNKCNGLLGFFAKLNLQVPVGSGTVQQLLTCGSQTPQCYKDSDLNNKPVMVSAYGSCTAVEDCDDYKSQESCTANSCKLGACEWKAIGAELGRGVCIPKVGTPPCRRCNELLGYCNKDACLAISNECYYDDITSGASSNGLAPQGCLPKQEMACRLYDTQADCTGGVEAQYNIQYQGTLRVTGDNSHTISKDKFSFGTCAWSSDHCLKDADNFRIANEDDCIEDGLTGDELVRCLADIAPPTTEILLKAPVNGRSIYGSSEITTLPVQVSDDKTPLNKIKTFTCLQKLGQSPCYPNVTITQLALSDEDALYDLRYFSMDANHNSEVIRIAKLNVTKDNVPRLNIVDIKES